MPALMPSMKSSKNRIANVLICDLEPVLIPCFSRFLGPFGLFLNASFRIVLPSDTILKLAFKNRLKKTRKATKAGIKIGS